MVDECQQTTAICRESTTGAGTAALVPATTNMDGGQVPSPRFPSDLLHDQLPPRKTHQAYCEPELHRESLPFSQDSSSQPLTADPLKQPNTSRSRATSRPPPVLHQPQQPITDAVHNAFGQSAVAQNQLDPELVRKVTEQVIRNLQTANLASSTPSASSDQSRYPAPPPQAAGPPQRSPAASSTGSIPSRYTPPSPAKEPRREDGKHGSASPDLPQSDHESIYSKESTRSRKSSQSAGTPRPPRPDEPSSGVKRSHTTASRSRAGTASERSRRRFSGSASTMREPSRPFRRDSKDSEAEYYDKPPARMRPSRVPSDVAEATTVEKIWQPLFDECGGPTPRLGQFLRGLAIHLIEDYEPKSSLIVTPQKMLRFFNETKLSDEHYPWEVIFGSRMPSTSLSKVYQKLLCQHHLVQIQKYEPPSVPALTPHGFEQFMACLIQAHPDTEFERLANAVMNMPISNADNTSERFPKELPRRLFPSQGNIHAEQRVVASLSVEPQLIQLRGATTMPPPPPASAPPQQSFPERERKPYSATPFANTFEDEDLTSPSVPLERERQPYSAREGQGKTYRGENDRDRDRDRDRERERERERERDRDRDRDRDRNRDSRPPTSFRTEPPPNVRSSRSNSGVPTRSSFSNGNGEPNNTSAPRAHRTSMQGPPPAMTNGMNSSFPKGPPRRSTPPPRNPYTKSEPLDMNGIPASQYASNLYPAGPGPASRDPFAGHLDEHFLRRNHNRRPTDQSAGRGSHVTDDDLAAGSGRGYPIPPRPPPSTQGYDSAYSSAGAAPVGSYPRGGSGSDNRRSTWYGPNNMGGAGGGGGGGSAGAGGSDGYGSFTNGGGGFTQGSPGQH